MVNEKIAIQEEKPADTAIAPAVQEQASAQAASTTVPTSNNNVEASNIPAETPASAEATVATKSADYILKLN